MVHIREERPEDRAAIRKINEQAFGQPQEADLVDALRRNCGDLLSLVAVADEQIVGHVLFSPVTVGADREKVLGMGLGPMAVLPGHQRQGVGTQLIEYGINKLRIDGCPFIIVLGHPEYYPRFGFEPANRHGIRSEWQVPDNAFMVFVLDQSKMQGVTGVSKYRSEFSSAL
jgi:putative acetyltransferase